MTASDLALGSSQNGVLWEHGDHRSLVATSSTFDPHEKLQLFFQLRCDSACDAVQMSVALYALPLSSSGRPALTLMTQGTARPGVVDVERELDLSLLKAGRYRLEVTLNAGADRPVIRRMVEVALR